MLHDSCTQANLWYGKPFVFSVNWFLNRKFESQWAKFLFAYLNRNEFLLHKNRFLCGNVLTKVWNQLCWPGWDPLKKSYHRLPIFQSFVLIDTHDRSCDLITCTNTTYSLRFKLKVIDSKEELVNIFLFSK